MKHIIPVSAVDRNGTDTRMQLMLFETDDPNLDIQSAVKAATSAYLQTEAGKELLELNCGCFNWKDFWDNVPNSICREYGFRRHFAFYCENINIVDMNEQIDEECFMPETD